MTNSFNQIRTIAGKDVRDALRTRLILIITGFMVLASAVAVASNLQGLGPLSPTDYFPLQTMRAFIEQIEILGSALGIVMGCRSAANERGNNTLPLMLTRPIRQRVFLAGKALGGAVLVFGGLGCVFAFALLEVTALSGVGVTSYDIERVVAVYASSGLYMMGFFLLGFVLALRMKRLPQAILVAFSVWLLLVLIAPQIGDTLDPDNQAIGGVFKQLSIDRAAELELKKTYQAFETFRTGIEQLSPSKHMERLGFALWGIKGRYADWTIDEVLLDKRVDIMWLLFYISILSIIIMSRPINVANFTEK